jgi:hypothetical protein
MAGCDDRQIDVERRLHGVLAEAAAAGLDAHLASCPACRAYQAVARGSEAGLRQAAGDARGRVDWARTERAARRARWRGFRPVVAAALGAGWVAGLAWISTAPAPGAGRMVRALPTMALAALLAALLTAWSARRLLALAGRDDALGTWANIVAADLAWARRMRLAVAALVAFFPYRSLSGDGMERGPALYEVGLALPLAAAWFHLRNATLPRATREARDLGLTGERAS